MEPNEWMKFVQQPQIMSAIASVVMGALWIAVKRLIRDVRDSIKGITVLTTRLEEQEKARNANEKTHQEKLEKLSDRVHRVEVSFAVLEREIVKKKRDNGSGLIDEL